VEGFDPNLLSGRSEEPVADRPASSPPTEQETAKASRKGRPVDPIEFELNPWVMRGTEMMYGYVVAAELILVAILELTDTHGKGAPAHPATGLSIAGLAASVLMIGLLQTRNRTFVALSTILASLLIDLPSVPNNLVLAKLFAVFIPILYGIVLVRRRSRSAQIRQQAGIDPAPGRSGGRGQGRRGAAKPAAAPTRTSGRYTPPKSKRTQSGSSRRR
jgi:hypothetical protein